MKTKEIAQRIGVSTSTIRAWTSGEWKSYISDGATGSPSRGHQARHYTINDLRVLDYISQQKNDALPTERIHENLKHWQAEGWKDLPPIENEPTPVMVSSDAVSKELETLSDEINRLEQQLEAVQSDNTELRTRIETLIAERARLEGQVSERRSMGFWLRIIAIIIAVMVVISGLLIWLVLSIGTV